MMTPNAKIIMHLIATNFYGGPEKQIIEHLKGLNKCNFEGIVASFLEGGNNEILERASNADLKHCTIPMCGPLDFSAYFYLNKIIRQYKVSLLCTHGYKACVMGWLAARRNRIPALAFSRGYTSENIKVAFYEWLEQQVLKNVDGIVAVSEGQMKKLQSLGIFGRKSWVIHNAVNVAESLTAVTKKEKAEVFERLGVPQQALLVVAAGRLSPEKGHRYLVEAVAKTQPLERDVCYLFCGEGQCMAELQAQSRDLGIMDRCIFPGFRRDLQDIFKVMDLLVLPSLTEGLPNVVLEAFALAKPVIATKVGGVPEVIDNDKNGILVPPKRPDLLAEAINKCLFAPEISRQMGEAGYCKVKSEFTFETQTKKLESIYHELLHCA